MSSAAGYLQLLGYGFQIAGMVYTASELKSSAIRARRQAQRNAERILVDAAEEVRLRRIQGQRLQGTQRNRLAASNVRVGTGSPLDVLAETAFTTETAVRRINELASRLIAEQFAQARAVKTQNRAAAIQNVLSGTAAALGAAGQSVAFQGSYGSNPAGYGTGLYGAHNSAGGAIGYGNIA